MAIVIIRSIIVYIILTAVMRIMGKRQLGEMELTEFVLAAIIADMAAHPLQDIGIPMINGLLPILTLFCSEIIISGLMLKRPRLRAALFGNPSVLIRKGEIDQAEMRKNRFTADELLEELRSQGITDISKVEYAVLETSGKLSVIPFQAHVPPTAKELGIKTGDDGFPYVIICDGRILHENLTSAGKDLKWLNKTLGLHKIAKAEEVYLMTLNASDQIYYCRKEQKK